jgi:hypothetical protein
MAAEYRAFDFWIGEWNVRSATGKVAGTNSIKREIGGCVLHERYETAVDIAEKASISMTNLGRSGTRPG